VLPTHYNHTLHRDSCGDLAIAAPLNLRPRLSSLRVFIRSTGANWQPFDPPNGLCLGRDPLDELPDSPGLALVGYLRWAAVRLAANGKFHANDY
jgi:hypothetical protein